MNFHFPKSHKLKQPVEIALVPPSQHRLGGICPHIACTVLKPWSEYEHHIPTHATGPIVKKILNDGKGWCSWLQFTSMVC